jgi:hypothetical protein
MTPCFDKRILCINENRPDPRTRERQTAELAKTRRKEKRLKGEALLKNEFTKERKAAVRFECQIRQLATATETGVEKSFN